MLASVEQLAVIVAALISKSRASTPALANDTRLTESPNKKAVLDTTKRLDPKVVETRPQGVSMAAAPAMKPRLQLQVPLAEQLRRERELNLKPRKSTRNPGVMVPPVSNDTAPQTDFYTAVGEGNQEPTWIPRELRLQRMKEESQRLRARYTSGASSQRETRLAEIQATLGVNQPKATE